MAEPYDTWHKQQTKRGERRRLDHGGFPSASHGRGLRWMARWRDSEGRQRSASFDRFEQAQRHQRKMETDAASSKHSGAQNAELRLASASALWLAGRRSKNVRTNAQYESRIRMHIDDPIGFLQVREIKPSTIVEWINGRRAAGLDETTIGLVLTHLSAILEQCVDDELIHRNPCRAKSVRSAKPKRSKKSATKVPLTGRQVVAVRDNLPTRYKALTDVGRALGLRQGEIFGLSPDDIDWTGKQICIRRQVARHGNRLVFAPVKASEPGEERERWVPVPDELAFRLIAHMTDFPPVEVTLPWEAADGPKRTVALMFTSRESKALNSNYFNWVWKAALEAADIITPLNDKPAGRGRLWEPCRNRIMHALRHLYASERIEAGMTVRTLATRLGHTDPAYTLRNYVHEHEPDDETERRLVDQALRGTPPSP